MQAFFIVRKEGIKIKGGNGKTRNQDIDKLICLRRLGVTLSRYVVC